MVLFRDETINDWTRMAKSGIYPSKYNIHFSFCKRHTGLMGTPVWLPRAGKHIVERKSGESLALRAFHNKRPRLIGGGMLSGSRERPAPSRQGARIGVNLKFSDSPDDVGNQNNVALRPDRGAHIGA